MRIFNSYHATAPLKFAKKSEFYNYYLLLIGFHKSDTWPAVHTFDGRLMQKIMNVVTRVSLNYKYWPTTVPTYIL